MARQTQIRETSSGKFGFEGDWGRKCICGHELGVHTGEAPHECMNNDRRHCAPEGSAWLDPTIEPTICDCRRFRPAKARASR